MYRLMLLCRLYRIVSARNGTARDSRTGPSRLSSLARWTSRALSLLKHLVGGSHRNRRNHGLSEMSDTLYISKSQQFSNQALQIACRPSQGLDKM